jgi:5-methylcytosine-specific restriction protein A
MAGADEELYLEVHHVRSLASGSSDKPSNAVALCPNCHRPCHHAADCKKVIKHLNKQVDRLICE